MDDINFKLHEAICKLQSLNTNLYGSHDATSNFYPSQSLGPSKRKSPQDRLKDEEDKLRTIITLVQEARRLYKERYAPKRVIE
jgi:hypothetical protein